MLKRADGHLFPAWPGRLVSKPQGERGSRSSSYAGLCCTQETVCDMGWEWQRRFSAIGIMPTGPALEQEKVRCRSCASGIRLCGVPGRGPLEV